MRAPRLCGRESFGGSLEWVTVDSQTEGSQCILNERRHLGFNLNFHLAAEGSHGGVTLWVSRGPGQMSSGSGVQYLRERSQAGES